MSWPTARITLRLRLPRRLRGLARADRRDGRRGCALPGGRALDRHAERAKERLPSLGGADYGTVTGWFRSEIAAIYGPLVIGAVAITGAAAATAGEEEERILSLVLAYPLRRSRLVASKAAAIAALVLIVALATWVGNDRRRRCRGRRDNARAYHRLRSAARLLRLRDRSRGDRCGRSRRAPLARERNRCGGRRSWLADQQLRPTRQRGLAGSSTLSLFYYYAGRDPLTHGVYLAGVVVLGSIALLLTAFAMISIERRDLRA